MEAVVDFPNRDAIETEACAWIAQLDGDRKPSSEDMAALNEWMQRSPLHQQELLRLAELWGDLNILTELSIPTEQTLSNVEFASATTVPEKLRALWQRLTTTPAYMMSLVLVAAVLSTSLWVNQQGAPVHLIYSTALGEQRLAELPDGSTLQLNTATQVEVDFSKGLRKIRLLKGEAHFDVAHNPNRPFEVYAGDGMVKAVGTAFSVYLNNHDVEVTVTEGRVELASVAASPNIEPTMSGTPQYAPQDAAHHSTSTSSDNRAVSNNGVNASLLAVPIKTTLGTLNAGQTTSFNGKVQPIKDLNSIDIMRKLSWREGMLIFSGESLEQVLQQVSRYTDLSIIITDPDIKDVRIGGYFQVGETDAMFDALQTSFGVQVSHISSTEVHLSRAPQSPSLQ